MVHRVTKSQTQLKQFSMHAGIHDSEAEAPVFWPPDVKSPLTGKDPDAGKD